MRVRRPACPDSGAPPVETRRGRAGQHCHVQQGPGRSKDSGRTSLIHALPSRVADAPVDQTEHERRRDGKYPENSAISIIRAPNTSVPRPPVFGFPDLPERAVWKQGPSDTDAVFPTGSTERRPLPKTPRSSPRLGQIRVKLPMSTPTTGKDFHLPSPGT